MNLREILEFLLNAIRDMNDEPRFRPGLDESKLRKLFAGREQLLVPEVLEAYQLYDGVDDIEPFVSWLSAEQALLTHQQLMKHERELFSYGEGLGIQSTWLPLMTLNGGDVTVCLDVSSYGLVSIDVEAGEVRNFAHNYQDYLEALVILFQAGKVKPGPPDLGGLEFDQQALEEELTSRGLELPWE